MFDIRQLPDAWDTCYKLSGDEGRGVETLYDLYYKVSKAIFDYRTKNKLSQKQLAEKLGVTQAMVSKLESGDYNYTLEQLWKISHKLEFKFDVLLEETSKEITITAPGADVGENVLQYPKTAVG